MSNNPSNTSTYRQPMFRLVHLKPAVSVFPVLFLIFFLVSEITYAQQKKLLKQDLFSVSFPNEQQGWASGRWGTVLHTEDGGQSWVHQDSGVDYTLPSITTILTSRRKTSRNKPLCQRIQPVIHRFLTRTYWSR